ncbi:serine/threonine protein kinase [Chitinispirillum alkaliphilum]|nr:serine/threonine protein kinase [Chitinispirillum alkaliphilum]
MEIEYPYKVAVSFPGNHEYIPSIRKYIYDILLVSGFSNKFAFRSEIIVDEVCNNAVRYGCDSPDSEVELTCEVHSDRIEFLVKDGGGNPVHINRLKKSLGNSQQMDEIDALSEGLGLNLVRMLSEQVDFDINNDNVTSIHVVRKREIQEEKANGSDKTNGIQ